MTVAEAVAAITDAGRERSIVEEDRRRRTAWLARRIVELSQDELDQLASVLPILERLGESD